MYKKTQTETTAQFVNRITDMNNKIDAVFSVHSQLVILVNRTDHIEAGYIPSGTVDNSWQEFITANKLHMVYPYGYVSIRDVISDTWETNPAGLASWLFGAYALDFNPLPSMRKTIKEKNTCIDSITFSCGATYEPYAFEPDGLHMVVQLFPHGLTLRFFKGSHYAHDRAEIARYFDGDDGHSKEMAI